MGYQKPRFIPTHHDDGTTTIPLVSGGVVKIDTTDFPLVADYRWSKSVRGYIETSCGGMKVKMHRRLLCFPLYLVDHINNDRTDNRRSNLRFATVGQNNKNTKKAKGKSSGYKGVSWNEKSEKWQATIQVDGKLIYLGMYDSEHEAAREYDRKAVKHFGEFANLNSGFNDIPEPEPKAESGVCGNCGKIIFRGNTCRDCNASRKWDKRFASLV